METIFPSATHNAMDTALAVIKDLWGREVVWDSALSLLCIGQCSLYLPFGSLLTSPFGRLTFQRGLSVF